MDIAMVRALGVQEVTETRLHEQVFRRGSFLYERLQAGMKLVSANRLHEVRYEDLVRDPLGELRALYAKLQLGGFDDALPHFEQYLAQIAGYSPNKHALDPQLRDEITRRWGWIIAQYGYSLGERESTQEKSAELSLP
jgi:hypothetical protein